MSYVGLTSSPPMDAGQVWLWVIELCGFQITGVSWRCDEGGTLDSLFHTRQTSSIETYSVYLVSEYDFTLQKKKRIPPLTNI